MVEHAGNGGITRVLIADPDVAAREHAAGVCMAAAAELGRSLAIDHAADGTSALATWGEHRPRLVIAEVVLEGVSGLSLLRRIEADDREACVVLVTTMSREADRYWGLRQGALAYLGKPYTDAALRQAVRLALAEGRKGRPALR